MNNELNSALEALCQERGLDMNIIEDALKDAIAAAYKRDYNGTQNVEVDLSENGYQVFSLRTVVEDEEFWDERNQISLSDARSISAKYEIGDTVKENVTPKNFGRVAAMTAKQIITQRLREAERGIIYGEYAEQLHKLVTGTVERIDEQRKTVYINIGKIDAIMPANEQPAGECYLLNETVHCYVSEVKSGKHGTQVIVSRTHPEMVKCLFEREVPEIQDGIVEIKSVSREAGSRTKIAVYSNDKNVDAQGACIGPRGCRVQVINEELLSEKIDIIKWSEDPAEYITDALSPADVISCYTDEETKSASVIVPDNQLSLAIGKSGQNVRLAARLTGWKIDIITESEAEERANEAVEEAPLEEAPIDEALDSAEETSEE